MGIGFIGVYAHCGGRFSDLSILGVPVRQYSTHVFKASKRSFCLLKYICNYWLAYSCLIIPIRGGFGKAPMNVGAVYFHENTFANHAAINVVWNVGFSLTEDRSKPKTLNYFSQKDARNIIKARYLNNAKSNVHVLTNNRPNIVLFIMESFSAKLIEPLGGAKGATPHFNDYCSNGILFTHLYATATRSDKGISAVLSSFPSLSHETITMFPEKSAKVPSLCRDLKEQGYNTAFYYGGDINFAGLNSYLINGGYQNIIDLKDFPNSEAIANWGVPDQFVFDKLFNDIQNTTEKPFFYTMFTLSNHEPFDIPTKPHFKGNDLDNKFLSTAYYTDSCLNDFLEKCKKSGIWENTLFIMVADHGSGIPGNTKHHEPPKFHIPLLWLGGVLDTTMKVEQFGSQLDIAKTVLHQMNLDGGEFTYGRDLLVPDTSAFAVYAHNYGWGFVNTCILTMRTSLFFTTGLTMRILEI